MKKQLKKWGNNLVLSFTIEEEKLYGLKEGDVIELDDMLFEKEVKRKC
ncbi:MAG: hypothetical protein AABW67_04220 [Nanoarchaeota archaeon]